MLNPEPIKENLPASGGNGSGETAGEPRRVLVVGAGGFVGGYIVDELVRRGWEVWCGVRATTSRSRLTQPGLRFLTLDHDVTPSVMDDVLRAAGVRWQAVVWNLGLTQALQFADFNRVNFEYVRRFVESLKRTGLVPDKFIYMSSLSVLGPGDERGFAPLTADMMRRPTTRYGLSKAKAEIWLEGRPSVPWIILRPTGVYGPHDKDYALMVDAVARGFDFSVGLRRQMLTFIHASDLARAVAQALDHAPVHRVYLLSEGRGYTQAEFRAIVKRAVGRRFVVPVRLPLWAARAACAVSGSWAAWHGRTATLNSDKYKILRQRNWLCDIEPARRDFGFDPQVALADGFAELGRLRREQTDKRDGRP